MIRVGSNDLTVHPYYGRRMLRLLKENDVEVDYKEFPGTVMHERQLHIIRNRWNLS